GAWEPGLAGSTRSRARRASSRRGRPTPIGNRQVVEAWKDKRLAGGLRYRIDPEHPAVRAVLDEAGPLLPMVRAMLRVMSESVPVQRIWIDTAENRDSPRTGFDQSPPDQAGQALPVQCRNLIERKGYSPEAARELLRSTEPFHAFPALIDGLPDSLKE